MLEQCALYYFNAVLNVKKSFIQGQVSYATVLSYQNVGGLAYRDEIDLLRHLYFPERPQDYARLAASAIGMAQASLGCSERFYYLCRTIWHELVIERKIKPSFVNLKWLKRVGMDELFDELVKGEFPRLMQLREWRYSMVNRSEKENRRQWPTVGEEGAFFFLNSL